MSMAGSNGGMRMKISMKALLAAGGALAVGIGAATTPAQAQGKTQLFANSHGRKHRSILRHIAHAPFFWR